MSCKVVWWSSLYARINPAILSEWYCMLLCCVFLLWWIYSFDNPFILVLTLFSLATQTASSVYLFFFLCTSATAGSDWKKTNVDVLFVFYYETKLSTNAPTAKSISCLKDCHINDMQLHAENIKHSTNSLDFEWRFIVLYPTHVFVSGYTELST